MKARSLVFTVLIGAVLAAELYVLIAGGGRGTVIVTGVIALELLLAAAFLFINRDEDIAPVQAVRAELRMLKTCVLVLLRQRRYSGKVLDSHRGWWVIPAAVTGAAGIECIAIELLVPWAWLRALILVVSLYSLILLWGIFGAAYTYPHFVDGTLVLRHAGKEVASIAAGEIANITLSRGYSHERYAIDEDTLILGNGNGSNVHIELASPLLVPAPKWPWQKEQLSHVNHVQVWFDAPSEAITAISRSA